MPQSSLTAWLKKPAAATQPPVNIPPASGTVNTATKDATLPQTPPSSSPEDSNAQEPLSRRTSPGAVGSLVEPKAKDARAALPPNFRLRNCTKEDIPAFKQLNSLLLPIPYPESFYRETIEDPLINDITLLATWHDDLATKGKAKGRLVGAIRCRILAQPPHSSQSATDTPRGTSDTSRKEGPMLYLSTLVLLSPYRSHGVAAHMLDILTKRAVEDYGITSVTAHVWEANVDGLAWYRKRGFKEIWVQKEYYRRLKPSGAVVVQRDVSVMDFLGG